MNQQQTSHLIWIDLEMTGLNPDVDQIIEIATLITDKNLNLLAEGPVLAIHQHDDTINAMDAWNTKHHTESGLIDRVRSSTITEVMACQQTLDFCTAYLAPGISPMCGNSICQDRRFLYRHMPELERFFHYRNIDVSTIKELARRWAPDVLAGVQKKSVHLALDDIRESIEELRYYRSHFFKE